MKERYEALELNIVKIPVEDTIMMSDLDTDSEEKKELGASDEHAGNSSLEKPEERSTEDSSIDTEMDMGTEQPSENLDNEVTIPDDWEE